MTRPVTYRLPADLVEIIARAAERRGTSRTALVAAAIEHYLGELE